MEDHDENLKPEGVSILEKKRAQKLIQKFVTLHLYYGQND